MKPFLLYIGDRNLSSWSLRAWLAVVVSGAEFDEEIIRLDRPETAAQLAVSPSHRVPALRHGELVICDSLAICEYVADLFPDAHLWPEDVHRRAHARSVSCEMHAGFAALRAELPMNIVARTPTPTLSAAAKTDLARIFALMHECRARYGKSGPYLFGSFSIADCMYAPVLTRFTTYGIELDETLDAYRKIVYARPAMQRWLSAAEDEVRA
jgi:glutathione S-transferase